MSHTCVHVSVHATCSQEFFAKYVRTRTPVKLTGLVTDRDFKASEWTRDSITRKVSNACSGWWVVRCVVMAIVVEFVVMLGELCTNDACRHVALTKCIAMELHACVCVRARAL